MTSTDSSGPAGGKIYTVSDLTKEIKQILESRFPIIWVEGEISNFRKPGSGHCYFTLKDEQARLKAVIFANQARRLEFALEDGLEVVGLGRITVYEPRGDYQIIFEHLLPGRAGALQAAFEQLKKKLADRGWFDQEHKQTLPFLPAGVTLISSATGAVIHDMINVITRRFPNLPIRIIPAAVQGDQAPTEIARAIALANERADTEVLVVARGGGSLEDLAPFNSEEVARAVFESRIPVVSAVGHETDFTICDFVADLRAPTPSAAAELIVPVKKELLLNCHALRRRLILAVDKTIQSLRRRRDDLNRRLIDPRRRIQDARLRLDDYNQRLARALNRQLKENQTRLHRLRQQLVGNMPDRLISQRRNNLDQIRRQLIRSTTTLYFRDQSRRLETIRQRLIDLDPRAVLKRGYSITRRLPEKTVVRGPQEIAPGDNLEIMVTKGIVYSTVTATDKGNN
ncbi:MAG: exodeoxyribonuclease VII large subunit [Desulfosudaceae bacterium]